MSKNKNTKINLGFRRRVSLYYSRFMTLIKIFIVLIVCILLFTNFFRTQRQQLLNALINITANYGFVLENLVTAGQKNINQEDIMKAIGTKEAVPIYSLNLGDIRAKIEQNPWVKVALVERRLPNTLYIAISEREPVAIWQFKQKLYLIDAEGTRITSKNIENFSNLIHLVGEDANVYALSLIEDLNKHPNLAKKVVSAVRYGHRRWDLNLEQNINVKMPEKDFSKAYEYLASLDNQNKLFDQNYKTINLKDQNKYYVEKTKEN